MRSGWISALLVLLTEQLHVEDVRRDAITYLDELTSMAFNSAEECEQAATSASASFAERMEGFQRRSNAARHHFYEPAAIASRRAKK